MKHERKGIVSGSFSGNYDSIKKATVRPIWRQVTKRGKATVSLLLVLCVCQNTRVFATRKNNVPYSNIPQFSYYSQTFEVGTLVSRPRHSWSHLNGTSKFLWYYTRVLLHNSATCLSRILATDWHFVLCFLYKLIHPMLVDLNSCIVLA
jgi:hypothetical protein